MTIESYLLNNQVPYYWANALTESLVKELYDVDGCLTIPEKIFSMSKSCNCWSTAQYYLEDTL